MDFKVYICHSFPWVQWRNIYRAENKHWGWTLRGFKSQLPILNIVFDSWTPLFEIIIKKFLLVWEQKNIVFVNCYNEWKGKILKKSWWFQRPNSSALVSAFVVLPTGSRPRTTLMMMLSKRTSPLKTLKLAQTVVSLSKAELSWQGSQIFYHFWLPSPTGFRI